MTVKNGDSEIILKSDGTIQLKNDSEELVNIVSELMQLIEAATTNTVLGPQPFINLAAFTALRTRLETLLGG